MTTVIMSLMIADAVIISLLDSRRTMPNAIVYFDIR